MNEKIKLYDTVKDKDGKRFRVTGVEANEEGRLVAKLKMLTMDGRAKPGQPRSVLVEDMDEEYERLDLLEVKVSRIEDIPPHERASRIETQAVRELSEKKIRQAIKMATFGAKNDGWNTETEVKHLREVIDKQAQTIEDLQRKAKATDETDCTQLVYDLRKELEALKNENRLLKESIDLTNGQLRVRDQEVIDLKKTISKMKEAHDEEVHALEDELMEAKALAKSNAKYADTVDDDRVILGEILHLSEVLQLMSTGMAKIAKEIIEKTEERI